MLDTYSYQYDTAHNQTQKTDPKGTTQYQYDSLNRLNYVLEPASLAGKLTQYTYDHAGNRQTETVTETDGATQKQKSTVTKYNYNEQNRLMTTEVTNEAGAKSVTKYVYDANGNLTAKSMETMKPYDPNTKPSFGMFIIGQDTSNLRPEIQAIAKSTAMYEYDHYNQLAVAKTSGGTSVYKYNGDGLRVEKEVNGTTTKYLYESDKIILELDGNGKEIGRNIYGTNLISKEVDGQKLSYMYNGHADVTSLIDGTGAVKNTYYYDAFGNVKEETGTAKNNITYAGYQYDKETGLYYLNSRMYDPVTARFMQEDTYRGQANDPLSLNLYTYCHNEPIKYTDPTGHVNVEKMDGYSKKTDMTPKEKAQCAENVREKQKEAKEKAAKEKAAKEKAAKEKAAKDKAIQEKLKDLKIGNSKDILKDLVKGDLAGNKQKNPSLSGNKGGSTSPSEGAGVGGKSTGDVKNDQGKGNSGKGNVAGENGNDSKGESPSKIGKGVYSQGGIQVNASAFVSFDASAIKVKDANGNSGTLISVGVGGGTPQASIAVVPPKGFGVPNAGIEDLKGFGMDASIGIDRFSVGIVGSNGYIGYEATIGKGIVMADVHVNATYTWYVPDSPKKIRKNNYIQH